MQADILRKKFLDFFKSKKHKIIESSSLLPQDDPTVLFTPAGMNQFKQQFLGKTCGFSRAASAQRCLRTDDLDKVGKTRGHHTFFEMLGNFSFGDYFKKEAIFWAWEFLTEELKISADKLWVSVYKDDDEAYKIWIESIKVPRSKIVKLGDKENFWPSEAKEKGPNGPCGPCSEIFFDLGNAGECKNPACSPACPCGRFVEIWNLVFTQFNRKEGGLLEPLPQKNIDTGMGLERLTAIMNAAPNNFETDLFRPIINEIISGLRIQPNSQQPTANSELIYTIADHIRAIAFSIYDGVLPSNDGRGYVVRKLIRKSILHLMSLGCNKPFLFKLAPVVSEIMKVPYPELNSRRENISEIILAEEKNFIATLKTSDSLLNEKFGLFLEDQNPQAAGIRAFQLYDTYGIPLELTLHWLNAHNLQFSQEAFDGELEKQKSRSKNKSVMKGDVFSVQEFKITAKDTKFLGYEKYSCPANVFVIIKGDQEVRKISKGDEAKIILDKTVFFSESGGQVGDTGRLTKGKSVFQVYDTQKSAKVIIHIGKVISGAFKKSDSVLAEIDANRRLSIARNHTATHLLQGSLRKILGPHVRQQGSLVSDEKLRFDFTHFKELSGDEIKRIEETVYGYVINNHPVLVKKIPLVLAKRSGALAFFGEKYEKNVRMVSIGNFSKELCGGSHLDSTGLIGIFKIIHEGSISSGVRRIEAQTGDSAFREIKDEETVLREILSALNTTKEKAIFELQKKISRIKELEKLLESKQFDAVKSNVDELIAAAEAINGLKLITRVFDGEDIAALRKMVDLIKQKTENSVICLAAKSSQKASLVIGLTQDLCQKGLDASKLITDAARIIGGSGGGRKDFAQAGGKQIGNFTQVFEELRKRLE